MLAVLSTPWFRVPALAVVVVTVQTVVISQIHLLGVSPDLVVLCAVASGLVGGPQRGTAAGFVFGLVYDLALTTAMTSAVGTRRSVKMPSEPKTVATPE